MIAYGQKCKNAAPVFSKGMVRVRVRKSGSNRGESFTFVANKGCASNVKSFSIPPTTSPLIVEIVEVKWDYWCQYYLLQGYSKDNYAV